MARSTAATLLALTALVGSANAVTFHYVNQCGYNVHPQTAGGESNSGQNVQTLAPGASGTQELPGNFNGRIWGTTDSYSAGPNTLAEFNFGNGAYYDISLVDGFNIPMVLTPSGTSPNCIAPNAAVDFNAICPDGMKVVEGGQTVACKSGCQAFGVCGQSQYSEFFKSQAPNVYTWWNDNPGTFFCDTDTFTIQFC